ncbi:MAG: hypothetical protein LBV61_00725, partial [Burkholderiaceae bacterium]|nr:hypothetical protein [Burkholderiaceae bacterium]
MNHRYRAVFDRLLGTRQTAWELTKGRGTPGLRPEGGFWRVTPTALSGSLVTSLIALGTLTVAHPAFAQCVPATAPATGQTVTCTGSSTTPV